MNQTTPQSGKEVGSWGLKARSMENYSRSTGHAHRQVLVAMMPVYTAGCSVQLALSPVERLVGGQAVDRLVLGADPLATVTT
jgi:hypothetical protein